MFSAEAIAAREELQASRYLIAEELAREGLRAAPDDFGLRAILAMALAEQNALEEAQAEADESVAHNQSSGWPHLARARVFMLWARHDAYRREEFMASAFIEFDQAVELEPEEPIVWRLLAMAHRDAENLPAAVQAARQALAIAPADSQTACLLTDVLVRLNRVRDAAAVLDALPTSVSDEPDVQASRGAVLLHSHRTEEAAEVLQRAVDAGCKDTQTANRLLRDARKGRMTLYRPWLWWELWLTRHVPSKRWRLFLRQVLVVVLAAWTWLILGWQSMVTSWSVPETAVYWLVSPAVPLLLVACAIMLHVLIGQGSDLLFEPPPWRTVALGAGVLSVLGIVAGLVILAINQAATFLPTSDQLKGSGMEWLGLVAGILFSGCLLAACIAAVMSYRSVVPPERRWLVLCGAAASVLLVLLFFVDARTEGLLGPAILGSGGATMAMAASRGRQRHRWTAAALAAQGLSAAALLLAALAALHPQLPAVGATLAFVALTLSTGAAAYSIADVMRALASVSHLSELQAQRRRELEARNGGVGGLIGERHVQ